MYNFNMENKSNYILNTQNGIIVFVKLVPNSSVNKIVDCTNEFLRIKISSPPIDNRANKELISYFSDIFNINKSKIEIISGEKSKLKKVLLTDAKLDDITKKITFMLNSINKK